MIWVALHLPALPLESFSATLPEGACTGPLALFDAQRSAAVVTAANAAAQAEGVKPGLRRATALALAPQLVHGTACAAREAQALAAVAHVALAFTPSVTCCNPGVDVADSGGHHVLLEVQASLRRFGGPGRSLPQLLAQLRAALAPLQHRIHIASAPTAQGAALLARTGDDLHCADLGTLAQRLDAAPVWLLGPGRAHWEALQGMGLRSVADLRRLPRAGLARRFGEALLDEIDRALGARPDPRDRVTLPAVFEARLELFARADTTEQVLHGAALLLARLVAWARAQQAQVRGFTLQMQHEPRHRHNARTPAASTLAVALAEPSCDAEHLRVLLRERLARLQLPAPTLELRLHCADVAQRAPPNGELFASAGSERDGLVRLIERLQARLGNDRVQRLQPAADHRPERGGVLRAAEALPAGAGRPCKPAAPPSDRAAEALRPVWLLPHPQPLPEQHSRPLLDGRPLQLLCGPERIEAGWWDAALAERDYFIAQAHDGALVWVYRARLPLLALPSGQEQWQGWFLQGRFA